MRRVIAKDLKDLVPTTQLANGFVVRSVLSGYLPSDHESRGNAVLMEWLNPEFVPAGDQATGSARVASVQCQMRSLASFDEFARQVEIFVDTAAEYHADFVLFPELLTNQLQVLVTGDSSRSDPSPLSTRLAVALLTLARRATSPRLDIAGSLLGRSPAPILHWVACGSGCSGAYSWQGGAMRWRLLAMVLVLSGPVGWWWWQREPVLVVVIDVGQVLVAPETANPDRWGRGQHRLRSGQRLRAQGDTVIAVDGVRWTLADNAEVAHVHPGTWQVAGSGRLQTAATPVLVRAPVGTLTVSAQSEVRWQTTPDRTDVSVEQGFALATGKAKGKAMETAMDTAMETAADTLSVPQGRRLLLLPERIALRVAEPGSEGLGLDAEAPDFVPPDQGWFAGVVVPVDDEPGRTRSLAAVADLEASVDVDAEAIVWRLTLRRSGRPFSGVRRAQARVWTAPTVDHLTVTWTADDGRVLGEAVVPVAPEAGPGWWDLEVRLASDEVAVGDRLAVFSLAVAAPASGLAPLRLAEVVLTP